MLAIYLIIRFYTMTVVQRAAVIQLLKNRYREIEHTIKYALMILLLVCILQKAYAQKIQEYIIYKNNSAVGLLTAILIQQQQQYTVNIHSQTKIKILASFNINVVQSDSFSIGQLVKSTIINEVNGMERFNNKLYLTNEIYNAYSGNHFKATFSNPIAFSSANILFFEPAGAIDYVYSPVFFQMLPMKKIAVDKYAMELPDGNTNYYTYENGICTKAIISTNYSTVQLVLKQK